jgi:hypothetical protein
LLATGIGVGSAVGAAAASAAATFAGKTAVQAITAQAAANVARLPRNFFINIIIFLPGTILSQVVIVNHMPAVPF